MAMTLGELSGIISLDEKPAMTALGRVRKGMRDTADDGRKSTDKMTAQQSKYADAVESASERVAKSKAREVEAANSVVAAEKRLAKIRTEGEKSSAAAEKAQAKILASRNALTAATEKTALSTQKLESAQAKLAAGVEKMRSQVKRYGDAATSSSERVTRAQTAEKKAANDLFQAQLALGNLRKSTPKDLDAITVAQDRLIKAQEKSARAEAATARAVTASESAQNKLVAGTEKLRLETQRYEAAVKTASANVAAAKKREVAANDALVFAQERLTDVRDSGANSAARMESAERRVADAQADVSRAHDDTAESSRNLEMAQKSLADSADTDSERTSSLWRSALSRMRGDNDRTRVNFHDLAQSLSWDGTRTGRLVVRSFAMIAVGATSVLPAVGALGSGVIAASGSVLTLAGSISELVGVAGLAPAALFAVGSGAGVLLSAFSGMGEALKNATDQTTVSAGQARLDSMTLVDAARSVADAERASSEQRAAAERSLSDAKDQAALSNTAAVERVTEAEERAAEARDAARRRVADAEKDLTRVVDQNTADQADALARVVDAERDVQDANRKAADSQRDLNETRTEALETIRDLQVSLEDSVLSERGAVLRLEDAQLALDDVRAAGAAKNSRAMRKAQLDLDEAEFALVRAKERRKDLTIEESQASKAGVDGNSRVMDSVRALEDSKRGQEDAGRKYQAALADEARVGVESAAKVAEANQKVTEAKQESAKAEKDAAKDVADAVKDQKRVEADSIRSVADAEDDAAKARRDAIESVEDANRSLERAQLQAAEASAKASADATDSMNALTPAAQTFAGALLVAYGRLGDVRDIAQENFFEGMDAPLLKLVDTVIPQLETGVGGLAAAYGEGARTIISALDRELGNGVLEGMFARSTEAAYILNDAIDPIVETLVTLTRVGMDYMPLLAAGFRDAATEFNTFVQGAADDGSLRTWIDNGIQGTKDLFSILGSVVGILDKLEDAARAGGISTTLGSVADGLDRIEEAVSGPVFQSTMSTIFAGAKGGAEGLLAALGPIGEAFRIGGPALAEFLRLGGEIAGTFVGSMFTAISDPEFGSGLTTFLEHVQTGVDELGPLLPGLFQALGDVLTAVGPIVEAFGPTVVEVLTIFAGGLASIVEELSPLLTTLAGSPVAVGIFAGVIGGVAILGSIATLVGNLGGLTTAFRLMWVAATGPVGWAVTAIVVGLGLIEKASHPVSAAYVNMVEKSGSSLEELAQTNSETEASIAFSFMSIARGLGIQPQLFEAARVGIKAAWRSLPADVKSPIFNIISGLLGLKGKLALVPSYFKSAVTGAMTEWNGLKERAKIPVRFVIEEVINKGLIAAFNSITGVNIPPIATPGFLMPAASPAKQPAVPKGQKGPNRFFAEGGYASPGWAVVGEEGPELVNFSNPGRVYTASETAAAVSGAEGAATHGEGNMGGFFEGNAASIRKHGAYYLNVAAGMNDWNFKGAANMWDGASGIKVKTGMGKHQGWTRSLERGGGILGYTTGTNIDMSPSWMRQLGPKQRTTVAAHEMGHAMGLPHNNKASIMQPNLGNMAATPTALDIRNMQTLYPGGSGKAGSGVAEENPLKGILGGLISTLTSKFPGGGMFVDASKGILSQGYDQAFSFIEDIKDGISNVAGDVVDNIRDFFGGGAATTTATLMDGGGFLRDTDGPTVIHKKKKPDAFTPADEWEGMKKDLAAAYGSAPEVRVYIGNEQVDARVELVTKRTVNQMAGTATTRRAGN